MFYALIFNEIKKFARTAQQVKDSDRIWAHLALKVFGLNKCILSSWLMEKKLQYLKMPLMWNGLILIY